ncbi:hypothetical protein [Pectobacterium brasiliense]|uniref:hypothetical protein n=1 Tax=Pectobacterium brasiliense TaxID=180957 RepID=UPI00227A38E1|nr:hypothetical protein [Pectobacterium brasiliense]WGL28663.1 hypothetical protein OWC53_03460 [Pectobacterium brasiliense]WJM80609.1 hypothetical protein QTI90_20510 [Pectobacterium brasiliense]
MKIKQVGGPPNNQSRRRKHIRQSLPDVLAECLNIIILGLKIQRRSQWKAELIVNGFGDLLIQLADAVLPHLSHSML